MKGILVSTSHFTAINPSLTHCHLYTLLIPFTHIIHHITMVELVEVEDESFGKEQVGPSDEDDYYTDTGSSTSFTASQSIYLLTLFRRLRDLI